MITTSSAIQAAMLNDNNRLTVISQNIANASTAGYKRKISVDNSFSQYMTLYAANNGLQQPNTEIKVGLPYLETKVDPSMGALNYTGNAFDLVADGNAYFAIHTPNGVAFTKQGSFAKNSEGILVNQQGYPVLGETGDIRLNGIKPKVDDQGNISEKGDVIGKLKLVTFKPGAQLNDIGNGLYMINGDSSIDTSATPKVQQGYQEISNVVIMDEMVKMIETMRHFEASQHFMQGYDDMLDKAINVVGEV